MLDVHRIIHALAGCWPWHPGAAVVNRVLERLLPVQSPRWVRVRADVGRPALALDLSDRLQRKTYYFAGAYARHYLRAPLGRLIERVLGPGDAFADVGANLGFYALHAARAVGPAGAVWAFEPDPATFASLARSARLNDLDQLHPVALALSDREGARALHRDPNRLASSLVGAPAAGGGRYRGEVAVPVTTFDGFARAVGMSLARLRLVKVDVEGEEPRTVAGMIESLAAARPLLWCEVRGPRGSVRAPDTYQPVRALLEPLGYRPYRWAGAARPLAAADLRHRGSFDVLFAPRERPPP